MMECRVVLAYMLSVSVTVGTPSVWLKPRAYNNNQSFGEVKYLYSQTNLVRQIYYTLPVEEIRVYSLQKKYKCIDKF